MADRIPGKGVVLGHVQRRIEHDNPMFLWALSALFSLFLVECVHSQDDVRVTVSPGGVRRYSPGQWSSVSVDATNRSDSETSTQVATYFAKEPSLQYAREMWLPPRSRRVTWLPMRLPKEVDDQRWSFDLTVMKLIERNGQEMIQRREGDELLPVTPLLADKEQVKTASIFRKGEPNGQGVVPDLDTDAYELMATARQLADLSRVIIDFHDDFAPPHPVMWETLDQVVLSGDRILQDSAGLAVLRDWLYRGGRLCIFLDRTSTETVAAILGHGNSIRVVDRVELDEFTIEDVLQPEGHRQIDRRKFEQPIELVRVLADDVEVHCRVNGWPAAFWKKTGNGEILFLTLGPRGWYPAQVPEGGNASPEFNESSFRDNHTLRSLAVRFYQARPSEPALTTAAQPLLEEKIGYRVPSRRLATSLLGLNGLALVVGGFWLARIKRLEFIALLLPVVAGLTTTAFLVIGASNSRSVPSSVAFAQLVQFVPQFDSAHVSGLAAIYQQETSDMKLTAGPNGLLRPLTSPPDGTTQRLLWTDNQDGRWMNVSIPAGSVQFARFDQRIQFSEPVTASGSFTPDGFVGKFPLAAAKGARDSLIASLPGPSMAIAINEDGSFKASSQNVLAEGQFLSETIVSEESRRRQDIYRELLRPVAGQNFAREPTLLTWLNQAAQTLNVPEGLQQQGTSLAAVPLRIERTPADTEFQVPATFIGMKTVAGMTGRSLAYNERLGTWIEDASRATSTRLRFALPQQVLPCKLLEANLTIKLNAPSRELHVNGVVEHRDELIEKFNNPSGVFKVDVTSPEWLQVDGTGGVYFTIEITEAEMERQRRDEAEKYLR